VRHHRGERVSGAEFQNQSSQCSRAGGLKSLLPPAPGHPAREALGCWGAFRILVLTAALGMPQRGSSSSSPSLSCLHEHLEGGLRRCTPTHLALSRYPAGRQGIGPAQPPPALRQRLRWFLLPMKTRFPSAVFTLPLNASRCPHCTLRAVRAAEQLTQHPAAGFHQTLFLF